MIESVAVPTIKKRACIKNQATDSVTFWWKIVHLDLTEVMWSVESKIFEVKKGSDPIDKHMDNYRAHY